MVYDVNNKLDVSGISYTNPLVAETTPIPVRMTPAMIARLDAAAQLLGNTRAGVVKLCLMAFLEDFERRGTAALPLDWEDVLNSLDGRISSRKPASKKSRSDSPAAEGYPVEAGVKECEAPHHIDEISPDPAQIEIPAGRSKDPAVQKAYQSIVREVIERHRPRPDTGRSDTGATPDR